ncbi:MFS transporter [Rickettsiella endosymbiont of Dermanyssus gallinae]|uniref:MFS transporter n=1 Tax=Rickettsiella endosymbiont of Dermanyssus gallinae TaxID=2856608 RepID=UPI001C5318CB|nr:MFS transporter [Rickettsiella endosymbiont of Dermanyssus gallinae]
MYNNDAVLTDSVPYTLTRKKQLLLASIICTLAAMFYMYEFILQVSPAVMTNELMRDLNLNAASLGTMAAFYYYSYTPMQLPAGLLYDRFGPRRLITLAVLICAIGALLFGSTHSVFTASIGRFFMGIGSAFSFIGALLLVSRWFPPHYFALLTGLVQLMSSVGAIAGQVPLASAINHWGWRSTIMTLSLIGAFLALLIWTIVRDSPETVSQRQKFQRSPKTNELKRLKQVCNNRQTWFIALYSFAIWAPITAFAALWGIPFLVANYGITTEAASKASAMIWLGIGIGSPLFGWVSDKIKSRSIPLSLSALLGIISLSIVIYGPHLPITWLYITLFIFGLGASGQALSFGVVKDNNPPSVVGTAIGLNNMAVVAGGALFQPLIGILLYYNWGGAMQDGRPFYGAADYQKALIILPLCYILALIVSRFLLRETHCKQQFPNETAATL